MRNMKKLLNLMIAAALICSASVFTSCTKQDNPVNPADNLAEKIIGKWIVTDKNGQPLPTDTKTVYTFVSPTKALVSSSITSHSEIGKLWCDEIDVDVAIDGNKMTLTCHPDEKTTITELLNITDINATEFTANYETTSMVDGKPVNNEKMILRFTKLTADYTKPILGLWECTGLTGGETYNDANGRLEFLSDGTYRYYRKDDNGQWQAVTSRDFQDYFVDGTLLATRWKNKGEDELREWWEIASIDGDQMIWTALRQNTDGTTFKQKMTWKKIDLNIPEKIIGKWIVADIDGQPVPTNEKLVYTFVSGTKAFMSASLTAHQEVGTFWSDQIEADVAISGSNVTLTFHPFEYQTGVVEYTVNAINNSELIANRKLTVTVNGKVVISEDQLVRYEKVTADYREAIVGTWEGRCTSEGSVFDDGQEHRWQYKADGTYVYYVKDGDNWVPSENTLNEYFVDGTLLCSRWVDNEQENREWWEISIDGDKMNWTALRQKEDGSTFTATFEMKKVE